MMHGTIKTLNVDKGFGFIKSEDGVDRFFHHSALVDVKIASLTIGDAVIFDEDEGERGPRAANVEVATA